MRNLLMVFMAVLLLPSVSLGADGAVLDRSRVCMMQDSVMEKPGIPILKDGNTYFGCCAMCSQSIAQDPDKYTKAKDPVTQVVVDKADAIIHAFNGKAFYFASEENRKVFEKDPTKYVMHANRPGK
jgi:YHS domain-containing protein